MASQADRGIPENVRWTRGHVSFAALHVVGSNDDLAPWTGNTAATDAQLAEERNRMAAAVENVRRSPMQRGHVAPVTTLALGAVVAVRKVEAATAYDASCGASC